MDHLIAFEGSELFKRAPGVSRFGSRDIGYKAVNPSMQSILGNLRLAVPIVSKGSQSFVSPISALVEQVMGIVATSRRESPSRSFLEFQVSALLF